MVYSFEEHFKLYLAVQVEMVC